MGEFYFSPYQIAKLAMGIEEAGAIFYEILANSVNDRMLVKMLTNLSKEELKHKEAFNSIMALFHQEDLHEYAVDVVGLMRANLNELKTGVFNVRNYPKDIQEALDIAIHAEKESIRIYTGMHDVYIEKFHPVLAAIIEEEKSHLKKLMALEF